MAQLVAIECIHAYSLIQRLPAMDDDDLRRGHPTVHKAFDEATAVLAGEDALQTLAFSILADHPFPDTLRHPQVKTLSALAKASGYAGMWQDIALDLAAEGKQDGRGEVLELHFRHDGFRYWIEHGMWRHDEMLQLGGMLRNMPLDIERLKIR